MIMERQKMERQKMQFEKGNKELTAAVAACLAGVDTAVQRALVERWIESSERNRRLWERMKATDGIGKKLAESGRADVNKGWKRVEARIGRRRALRRGLSVAAACAAVALFAVLVMRPENVEKQPVEVAQKTEMPVGAQLILADGSVVDIDRSGDVEITGAGATIDKESSHIDYSRNSPVGTDADADFAPVYNELIMPNGKTFTTTLSDGSRVFLNAESRLRFPVNFSNDRREVELDGEAYFWVAKNEEKPFVIKTGGVEVAVLGTEFNLRAYGNEAQIVTTLVSGRVQVRDDEHACELVPGQQAVYTLATGELSRRAVDVSFYTAWCRNEILFKDTPLDEIMRNLSRWYDVKYEFLDETAAQTEFGGSFRLSDSIDPILDMIRRTGLLDVRRSGDRIYFSSRR